MKRLLFCIAAAALWTTAVGRAEGTWKGTISDSMCGVKHSADKHGGKTADHTACVEKCIKGGADYVFLGTDKLFKIVNQSFADLKKHAGHEVIVTGEMKDDAITVSKIEMPKAEEKK